MSRKTRIRNLIFLLVPIFISQSLLLAVSLQMLRLDDNKDYIINDISEAEMYYSMGRKNVEVPINNSLIYSGFDYESNGKNIGKYFYLPEGNKVYLFLLDDKTAGSIPGDGSDIYAKLTLIKDSAASSYISSEYIKQLGEDISLDGYIDDLVLSSIDYPINRIRLIYTLCIFSTVVLIGAAVYMVISFIRFSYNEDIENTESKSEKSTKKEPAE